MPSKKQELKHPQVSKLQCKHLCIKPRDAIVNWYLKSLGQPTACLKSKYDLLKFRWKSDREAIETEQTVVKQQATRLVHRTMQEHAEQTERNRNAWKAEAIAHSQRVQGEAERKLLEERRESEAKLMAQESRIQELGQLLLAQRESMLRVEESMRAMEQRAFEEENALAKLQ